MTERLIKSSRLRLSKREEMGSIVRKGSFNSFRCQKNILSYQDESFRHECTPERKEGSLVIKTRYLGDVLFSL